MKLRIGVASSRGTSHDITLSCDVTATVGDAARALIGAGIAGATDTGTDPDPDLARYAATRFAHVTLVGGPVDASSMVLLDPATPVVASGLQSGWQVEVLPEFAASRRIERLIPSVGTVQVLSGRQEGARFSLIRGANLIGRERSARILLDDRSVSRPHAIIHAGDAGDAGDAGA
mgnify:CR=1 FL=1